MGKLDGIGGVEGLFRASVAPELLHHLTHTILELYEETHKLAALLVAPPFDREVRPYLRRSRISLELLRLEDLFHGVKAEIQRTSRSSLNVTVVSGDVLILVARASGPSMMIPPSEYRKGIATRALQGELFGHAPAAPDAKLYGVVLHGGERGGPTPAFIVLRFPTTDHTKYLDTRIDLLHEYTIATQSSGVEEVVPTHQLTLRQGVKEEGDSA